MKDPTPWSKADATAFERQLLDAAKHDRAPTALKLRMAQGLASLPLSAAASSATGTGASATSTTGTTAHASGAGGLLFSPPVLWGSLTAVLLAGALGWQQLAASSAPAAPRAATPVVSAPSPPATLEPTAVPEIPAPAAVAAAPTALAAPASSTTSAARAAQAAPAARLREELALLDAARSALVARDSARALELLDQHAARYTRGALAPEADALRIDTYVQRGATARAEKLSRRFLERYPAHPLTAHIATVAR
jgi:hypothetical protein